jgi:hypothetical protein
MDYRNGNYCAFYVEEPFNETNLGAYQKPDFRYYSIIKAMKANDPSFPFVNSHDKTYQVRDGSNWETTLKPRIHERLRKSKNIILFLSSSTKDSRALREEIDYGVNKCKLPVITVYPELSTLAEIHDPTMGQFTTTVCRLWNELPVFRDAIKARTVPIIHILLKKEYLQRSLADPDLTVQSPAVGNYFYQK